MSSESQLRYVMLSAAGQEKWSCNIEKKWWNNKADLGSCGVAHQTKTRKSSVQCFGRDGTRVADTIRVAKHMCMIGTIVCLEDVTKFWVAKCATRK